MIEHQFRRFIKKVAFSALFVLTTYLSLGQIPSITSFSPASGPVGTDVTITGTNFSSVPAENIVWFGAVKANVSSATSSELKVTVPAGATYQPFTVTTNGLTAYSDRPFDMTFQGTTFIDATAFDSKIDFTTGTNPQGVVIGDIDGDGKPDIIVTNWGSDYISVYRNISTTGSISAGSFEAKVDFTVGGNSPVVALSDIDGDGKKDLVVACRTGNVISVFRNTSTSGSITAGSFAAKVDFTTGNGPDGIAIGDIDGDGKPDIVVTNYSSNTVSVFRNTSTTGTITSGSFASKVDFITGLQPCFAAIGDIDSDGKPDLVVTNYNSQSFSIFRNTSTPGEITSGSFDQRVDLITGKRPYGLTICDLDGDNKPDVSVVSTDDAKVSVFRNIGSPGSITSDSFAAKVDFTTGTAPYSIVASDINGDGKPDLVVGNYGESTVSVFKNSCTPGSIWAGSFAGKVSFAGGGSFDMAVGDIDGDGKPDLVVTSTANNTVSVLHNKITERFPPAITSFTPASGPAGTIVTITGTNFSAIPSENKVWFGAVMASVSTATTTQLTVTVPTGTTYQPITVTVNGLTCYSSSPFIVTIPGTNILEARSFAPKIDFTPGSASFGVAIGDLDMDGKPDMAVANWGTSTVSVFRNISSSGSIAEGSFEAKVDFNTGSSPHDIAIGDIDGDGKPDIVVSNMSGSTVSVFRNTSTPGSITASSFAPGVEFPVGARGLAIGDIDGDGKPDLAVISYNVVSVLRNSSVPGTIDASSFCSKVDFNTALYPERIVINDMDGDGKNDMVVVGSYNAVSVFRNTSVPGYITTSSFAERVDFTTSNSYGVAIGDLDMDGKPDLVVTNNTPMISVFRNISTPGSFTSASFAPKVDFGSGGLYYVAIGDIDGDGKPDIAGANPNDNSISVFRNTSTPGSITAGSFADRFDFTAGTQPFDIAIADIDGDNKQDLITTNYGDGTISVLRNKISEPLPPAISSFSPTSGPIGTMVTISGSNFDPTPANNIVWFGAVQANVTSATATQLIVSVPAGAAYKPFTVTTNGLTAYSNIPFNVTFLSTRFIDATAFASKVDFPTGTFPWGGVAIGDLDCDGKPDMVIANFNGNSISVLRNTSSTGSMGAGSFADKVDLNTGPGTYGVAIGDIDGDGKPDIIVTNSNNNTVSIFRNTSTPGSITAGSFAARVDLTTGTGPWGVAACDIDGDGKPDLIVANAGSNTISVFRNMSAPGSVTAGSFASRVDFATGDWPSGIAVGDIDGDGKTDIAVTNMHSNTVSIFRNTCKWGYISTTSLTGKVDFTIGDYITGGISIGIALVDIDGDGKLDIAVTNQTGDAISVFRNNSTSGSINGTSFIDKINFPAGTAPQSIAAGDIDGDGKPDLAVTNNGSGEISVFKNKSKIGIISSSSFSAKVTYLTEPTAGVIAIGDIDGDSQPEIAVTNTGGNSVSVFRNTMHEPNPPVITSFSPATGPVGTTVTITGTNFSTTSANNIVWFGAVKASVTSATSTQLVVNVPAGASYQPLSITVDGLTAWSARPFNVTFPNTEAMNTNAFIAAADFTTGNNPQYTSVADIDGDGKPDIVVSNLNSNTISVFRNTSVSGSINPGSFAGKVDFATGMNPKGIAVGDIDGDGKQDIVVTNQSGNTISIFRNTSSIGSISASSFAEAVTLPVGVNPYAVALCDIDGDGKPDLLITNFNSSTISIYKNMSSPGDLSETSFETRVDFPAGMNLQELAMGDIDGDGKPDLVVPNWYSGTVSVFRNTSTKGSITVSSFADKVEFSTGTNPLSISITDFDGDGKKDLIIGNYSSMTISVFHNKGSIGTITSGTFDPRVDFVAGSFLRHIAVGDLDGDGKPDLTFKGPVGMVSAFRNTSTAGSIGTDSFSTRVDFSSGGGMAEMDLGDIDGDGKPDLIFADGAGNYISILRNRISEPMPPVITYLTPISGPVGSLVTINGTNFSTTASNNIVWFGAVKATVTAATATYLTVTVPPGATYQPITVTVNGLTASSREPFDVTFPGSHIIDASSFAPKVEFSTGTAPVSSAFADIDGDGKPDLVIVNGNSNTVSVYRNTSSSGSLTADSFSSRVDFNTGTNPNRVAIGDIDGDGKPDLVVINQNSNTVSVFRNTSTIGSITSSSFADKVDFSTGYNPYYVAIGDIDGDGKPDLAVTNWAGNTVSVFKNTCISGSITSESFAAKVDLFTGSYPSGVAIKDIDGDDKPDLVVNNFNDKKISIFRNISSAGLINSGSFEAKVDLDAVTKPLDIAVVDIDGDMKPDIVVNTPENNMISVFRNISTSGSINAGSFESKVDFTTENYPFSFNFGDIDGDGKPDLVVSSNNNLVSVFKNTSSPGSINSGSFGARNDFVTVGSYVSSIAICDLDGDSKPDIAVTNGTGSTVSILRNRISELMPPAITSFTPTSGPVGTVVTITGTNFSTTASDNIVWFGAVRATVTAASATSLLVTAPSGATYKPISVTVNGLTAYASASFNMTFTSPLIINSSSFTAKTDFATGASPEEEILIDVDGDGKPDLIVANANSNTVSVYRNISTSGTINSGSFAPRVDFVTGAGPSGVAAGDLDGDGKPDLVVAFTSGGISLFRNNATPGIIDAGTFSGRVDLVTGNNPIGVLIGDVDLDGKPDIITSNWASNTISVFHNKTIPGPFNADSFSAKVDFPTGTNPSGIASGDIDMDGKPDLAVANYGSNSVSFFKNVSEIGSITSGSFMPRTDISIANPYGLNISDIDMDGKPDLLVTKNSSGSISVFRNISTPGSISAGSFESGVELTTSNNPDHIAVGDIDGDGKPDLAITNFGSAVVSIIKNNCTAGFITSGSFSAKIDFPAGANPRGVEICDIDGDLKPDVAVTNTGSNSVSIFRNIITEPVPPVITSFSPASGPVGTSVTIDGSNFSTVPSENIVKFGIIQATVAGSTASQLVAIVPTGAVNGTISVTVNGLTGTSVNGFTVTSSTTEPPVIASLNPASGQAGSTMIINGSNFSVTASENIVKFGLVPAVVIGATATQLSVTVPSVTAGDYIISVTVKGLTAISSTPFGVTSSSMPPVVSSFSPASGSVGTSVTIDGSNFSTTPSTNIVKFGIIQATVAGSTPTQLVAIVPAGAVNGTISVTVNGLTGTSANSFTVTSSTTQPPVISSINPTSGQVGSNVIINGNNFDPAPANNIVRFGTRQATVTSATTTSLSVNVPDVGTGDQLISVTVNSLTGISGTPFNVTPPPQGTPFITSFNPSSGTAGTTVTITGANFDQNLQANVVRFGNVLAVVTGGSTVQLTVIVPDASGDQTISVTVNGITTYSGNTFTIIAPEIPELESTIITPNGDGINEHLIFKNFSSFGTTVFQVYNSRGALVFWNNEFTGEWDITVNGKKFDTGGYFYILKTEKGTFRGSFSIVR